MSEHNIVGPDRRSSSGRRIWDVVQTIAVLATCAVLISAGLSARSKTPPKKPLPGEALSLDGAPTQGSVDAKFVLMIFTDYQCPFCGKFARDIWPEIRTRYVDTGQVLVAFRQLPLENIHPNARIAASAALCANQAGRFVEMDRVLFADQKHFDRQSLVEKAQTVGLNRERFEACIDGSPQQLAADLAIAKALGTHQTPTFFIGRREGQSVKVLERLQGAASVTEFENAFTLAADESWLGRMKRTYRY